MHWEETFRIHAGHQEGLLASFQARALGATRHHWYQARHNGRWEPWGPRLIIEGGLPRTDRRRALAAVLESSPGAWLHAEAALGWLGMPAFDLRHLMVARGRDRNGKPATLGALHELRSIRAHDVIVVRGVATETALRAIWVIADRLPLVVETNSETFHTTPTDQAADELRYHRLTLAGYTVGVVWQRDLWRNPRAAVETVRIARAHAAAGRAVVVHSPGCPWTTSYLGGGMAA